MVVDAGHGGETIRGRSASMGHTEKDINLQLAVQIAQKLKKYLEAEDVEVVLTRERISDGLPDANVGPMLFPSAIKVQDMKRRIEIIEKTDPVLTVSIHQNSYPEEYVHGAQVFIIPEVWERDTGFRHSGSAGTGDWTRRIIAKSRPTTVLLSSEEDQRNHRDRGVWLFVKRAEAEKLCDEEYQDRIAWLIHRTVGILRYLKQSLSILPSMIYYIQMQFRTQKVKT